MKCRLKTAFCFGGEKFGLAGTSYTIRSLAINVVQAISLDELQIRLRPPLGDLAQHLTLHLGSDSFALADATLKNATTFAWSDHGLSWADGNAVCLALTVDGPDVSSVELTSIPTTYAIGDPVEATVNFSAAVDITGTPQLELDFAGTPKLADCVAATNTNWMGCYYEVVAGDVAAGGVAIAANKLTLNGGTITATGSTTITADLDHGAVAIAANHKVDGIRPTLVTTGSEAADDVDRRHAGDPDVQRDHRHCHEDRHHHPFDCWLDDGDRTNDRGERGWNQGRTRPQ